MSTKKITSETALVRFLVQNQLVSPDVIEAAQAESEPETSEVTVLEWLARKGLIDEEHIAMAMAMRMRLPFVNLSTCTLDPEIVRLVKEELATRYRVIPLRIEDDALIVGTANPLDRESVRALEFATGQRIRLAVTTPSAIMDALGRAYHFDAALNAYLQNVPGDGEVPVAELEEELTNLESLKDQTALPPVVKLLNLILLDGIRTGASDIHVEATANEIRVRYRIDGMLKESFQFPKWVLEPLVARCKVLAKLDITERAKPQDGRIRIHYGNSLIDLRMSSLPTQFGEKVTMRILNSDAAPKNLNHLSLSDRDLRCIRHAITRPQGMVLVTGPTGSGKTTTLYGMLGELISPIRNIVTIENPIEYQMKGVNQVEINDKRGLTFANTLRSILRQDPDVVLVGEIRDRETAEIAVQASQTGHLVLSTLHTNDAIATVTRLMDLGIEPYLLVSALNLVIAQRLVRKVCERCAEPYRPDAATIRALQLTEPVPEMRRARGCGSCHGLGYAGRAAVLEVMAMTPAMTKLIESKAAESAMRLQAQNDGMTPLLTDAVRKMISGITNPDEVMRVVDVSDGGARCPTCDRAIEDSFTACPHCGTVLRLCCVSCGMQLQQDWQTCPYCRAQVRKAPAVVATATPEAAPPKAPAAAGPISADSAPQREYRVLVVDDEPDFRRLISLFLEQSDLPVSIARAANGPEALELAQMNPPDLVLLDIMMPEMDGFDVCARLRANVRTTFIPILMLTALNDPHSRTRAFLVGTDDYVPKPFDRGELLARVRRVLQRTYGLMPARDDLVSMRGPTGEPDDDLESLTSPANPTVSH
ncbi:MAG: hypothetical protein A3J75_01190 [Acidobacteria bacterium RBG_16_68_9]|nr:MAG: hypothetical protein A3J75_01190 [Acidobacteria bacterium RBG_16_68_9]